MAGSRKQRTVNGVYQPAGTYCKKGSGDDTRVLQWVSKTASETGTWVITAGLHSTTYLVTESPGVTRAFSPPHISGWLSRKNQSFEEEESITVTGGFTPAAYGVAYD